ncbi:ankyrin repeat protein [Cheloniid poxvirus 1]|nr:ankyrin repeat protein [Cheloniid poxvirus 1]
MISLYLSMYIDTKEDILKKIDSFNHYKHYDKLSAFPCIPFHQAVEARNLGVVKELLSRGVNVNRYDHRGLTPLHIACMAPNKQGMKELISIYIKDKIGYAYKAINTAFHNRNVYIFKSILIDYFKKEYTSDIVDIKKVDTEIVRLLLEYGADVNKVDKNMKSTPLHFVADYNNTNIMEFLILYGANVNIPDKCDNYPLHKAVCKSNIKGVEILLRNGAYTNVMSLCGNTPLHISSGSTVAYEIFKMLLEHDVCVNVKSSILGLSALHIAIRDEQKTKLLLEYKADINSVNSDNDTPISVAVKKYSGYNICKMLVTTLCIQEYTSNDIKNKEGFKINIECISKNKVLKEIKDKCDSELRAIQDIVLSNEYTVIEFLKEYSPILDRLIHNNKISSIPFEKFEIYGDILRCNIKNAIDRNLLILGAIESMDNILYCEKEIISWNCIPLEIKHKIMTLLDNNSLCNIIAK